jgi:23S rRNA (cytosine1962-C5)-methyltransferase
MVPSLIRLKMAVWYTESMNYQAVNWLEYRILDAGNGEKLEQVGLYRIRRPESNAQQILEHVSSVWKQPDAHYVTDGKNGRCVTPKRLPETWIVQQGDLRFEVGLTPHKHIGIFPEQATNWRWIAERIAASSTPVRVLNLFAYTGGATLAAAQAGASVVHVDASKAMVQWAKRNAALNGLSEAPIRYLVDDVLALVKREIRRGHTYHAIILDPPAYGRGPDGQLWKFETMLGELLDLCRILLDPDPLFMILNTYAANFDDYDLEAILSDKFRALHGDLEVGELTLPIDLQPFQLPCGLSGRLRFK